MRANWALHERIASITSNAMANAVYKGTLRYLSSSSTAFWKGHYRFHEALVRAIIDSDEKADTESVHRHNAVS